ncbi:MAG: hypothetical protein CSA97_06080 [Bacteroidetes bacterium]|nr:MAG: hypothetical protein CSA97_06080 [Bacteroidota bacterium]
MRGLVVYSSVTGNTRRLAEKLYEGLRASGEWSLQDMKDGFDGSAYDVILFGGWAEGGSLNKQALKSYEQLEKSGKRIGLFMTMGARTSTEHGRMCRENLLSLLDGVDSLGVQTLQGYIAPELMEKLGAAPDSVIPASVKEAMQDGVNSYQSPTDGDYEAIVSFFREQL